MEEIKSLLEGCSLHMQWNHKLLIKYDCQVCFTLTWKSQVLLPKACSCRDRGFVSSKTCHRIRVLGYELRKALKCFSIFMNLFS